MTKSYISQQAPINFDENNIPINMEYDDSFYSRADGFAETETVFIQACDIINRFQNCDGFVIAETGFGTGLNFLVTMKKWSETIGHKGVLHFISFEKHILPKEIAAQAHKNWPEISEFSQKLIAKWPKAINGIQRIWFAEFNIALTLIVGDINETIQNVQFVADAWFLDGFAPSKNPQMWSLNIFENIRRLSSPDVKIGTYSVARIIRDNLAATGFEYSKRPGFAGKRERLEAWLGGEPEQKSSKRIAIIGGGIAGACLYNALKKRGHNIIIFDNDSEHRAKASGNYAGLIMPRIDRQASREGRFFINSFVYAASFYRNLGNNAFEPIAINEIPKSVRDFEKLQMFKENPPLPDDILSIENDNFLHLYGGKIMPQEIVKELTAGAEIIPENVYEIEKSDGSYRVKYANQSDDFDIVICACGTNLGAFTQINLPINGKAGVVSIYDKEPIAKKPIAGKGYCISHLGKIVFGATFDAIALTDIPEMNQTHHQRNRKILDEIAPDIAKQIEIDNLSGRAAIRVVSKDKLPMAGKIGDGLFILGALGSRGFSTAPILAEQIAAEISSEPYVLEDDIIKIIAANRFDA